MLEIEACYGGGADSEDHRAIGTGEPDQWWL